MIYTIDKLEKDIQNNTCDYIPKQSGVYRVLNLSDIPITFLPQSTNTKFPAYDVAKLQAKYDKTKSSGVLYIGKGVDLNKRIKQYVKYGLNLVKNHKGGRSIFQIAEYKKLCIEVILCDNCECVEKNMLVGFRNKFGELPVANMRI